MPNDEWGAEIVSPGEHDAEAPATRGRRKRSCGQMYALSLGIASEDLDRARCHMHIRRLHITAWIYAGDDGPQKFIDRFLFYCKYVRERGVGGDRQ